MLTWVLLDTYRYVLSINTRKLHVLVGVCQNILSSVTLVKENGTFHKFLSTRVTNRIALTELLSSSDLLCVCS